MGTGVQSGELLVEERGGREGKREGRERGWRGRKREGVRKVGKMKDKRERGKMRKQKPA